MPHSGRDEHEQSVSIGANKALTIAIADENGAFHAEFGKWLKLSIRQRENSDIPLFYARLWISFKGNGIAIAGEIEGVERLAKSGIVRTSLQQRARKANKFNVELTISID